MAKKKVSSNKNKKKQFKLDSDVKVVLLILIGIVMTVLIYKKSSTMGIWLNDILGGIFGIIKFVAPIIPFVCAIYTASKHKDLIMAKVIPIGALVLCFSSLLSIIQMINNVLEYNISFSEVIDRAYHLGTTNKGGGVLGAIIAYPLAKLFSPVVALIIVVGVMVIVAVIVFRLKPGEKIGNYIDKKYEERELNKQNYIEKTPKKKSVIQEDLGDQVEGRPETAKERKQREKEEKRQAALQVDEQLTINMMEDRSNKNKDYIENNIYKNNVPKSGGGNELFETVDQEKEDKTKEVLQLEHSQVVADEHYEYPPVEILSLGEKKATKGSAKALTENAAKLQKTLFSFGVSAKVQDVSVGPTITRYELKPAEGTRVSKIANLADDIALNLAAETIRIEAPIPGKQAVGIEVPNETKEAVHLREVIDSDEFENNKSKLSIALGKDVAGKTVVADIAKMPHVLIAGSTGSGKSVCINSIITSIVYNAKPSEVKLVMVDPKVVELSVYNGIPHLLIPVVTDPKKAAGALAWAVIEMDERYSKFAQKGVRDLNGYNKAIEKENENAKLPQIVIIIDELADLMMVAAKDVEEAICRLAQKARAAGMHLVIATQRPSVDVITGLIKANVPSRIAFAVSSQVDSRTILDCAGAEKLLGKGDMLFYPVGATKPQRIQGAFVSDEEVEKIVDFIKSNAGEVVYNNEIIETIENNNKSDKEILEGESVDNTCDPFLNEAIETVVETGQASTSFIQRKFKVGYARAGRIIDQMEERGIISGYQGSKPREVLMSKERWEELKMQPSNDE
ncbi:MAG: DNA translocase FtsK [Clostridia bacterium]|nr:DNA translocase FtsK [Clostridia bacterium]